MKLELPLEQMSVAEKLHAIEALWADLSRNVPDEVVRSGMPRFSQSGSGVWQQGKKRFWIGMRRRDSCGEISMKVRILESARRDLRAGHTFCEQQQEGIGDYFLDMLCAEIDSLALYGGVHPVRLGYHRMLSAKFPYAVLPNR